MTYEWDRNWRFISNYGAGPLMARILCVSDDTAVMERWNPRGGKRAVRFELPLKYLSSPRCGWRRADGETMIGGKK